jgi:hypothetical protein
MRSTVETNCHRNNFHGSDDFLFSYASFLVFFDFILGFTSTKTRRKAFFQHCRQFRLKCDEKVTVTAL